MSDRSIYSYHLPHQLIASKPASPRDTSVLMVYDTKENTIVFDTFLHISRYLPKHSFLVLNETKVVPSRVILYKKTGGKVKTLFLVNEKQKEKDHVRFFCDRMVEVGDDLFFNSGERVTIIKQEQHIFTAQMQFLPHRLYSLLSVQGTMPIPMYIKDTPLDEQELRHKYQTVFAKYQGSAAAPTASLHFTNRIFTRLEKKQISNIRLTLHVGMGTFAPVTESQIKRKKLHLEWYEISASAHSRILQYKKEKKPLVAVGTTAVRTLESVYKTHKLSGATDLFIYPPYRFLMVDHMITNFHLPSTSLMMLVEAFLQYKKAKKSLVELYEIAIEKKLRFYSFGDAMLIL